MKRINDVINEFKYFIDQQDLEDFIARGWVCPIRDKIDYIFEDIDIARIHLICELYIEMKIEPDAMTIILSLMDQLYETRTRLAHITQIFENQPNNIRNAIIQNIKLKK